MSGYPDHNSGGPGHQENASGPVVDDYDPSEFDEGLAQIQAYLDQLNDPVDPSNSSAGNDNNLDVPLNLEASSHSNAAAPGQGQRAVNDPPAPSGTAYSANIDAVQNDPPWNNGVPTAAPGNALNGWNMPSSAPDQGQYAVNDPAGFDPSNLSVGNDDDFDVSFPFEASSHNNAAAPNQGQEAVNNPPAPSETVNPANIYTAPSYPPWNNGDHTAAFGNALDGSSVPSPATLQGHNLHGMHSHAPMHPGFAPAPLEWYGSRAPAIGQNFSGPHHAIEAHARRMPNRQVHACQTITAYPPDMTNVSYCHELQQLVRPIASPDHQRLVLLAWSTQGEGGWRLLLVPTPDFQYLVPLGWYPERGQWLPVAPLPPPLPPLPPLPPPKRGRGRPRKNPNQPPGQCRPAKRRPKRDQDPGGPGGGGSGLCL